MIEQQTKTVGFITKNESKRKEIHQALIAALKMKANEKVRMDWIRDRLYEFRSESAIRAVANLSSHFNDLMKITEKNPELYEGVVTREWKGTYMFEPMKKKEEATVNCRRCGASFVPQKSNHVFCSDYCRKANHAEIKKRGTGIGQEPLSFQDEPIFIEEMNKTRRAIFALRDSVDKLNETIEKRLPGK
jgi:hypothetical protein